MLQRVAPIILSNYIAHMTVVRIHVVVMPYVRSQYSLLSHHNFNAPQSGKKAIDGGC